MQNVNFTSGIRPVSTKDFSKYIKPINPENFVDYPWTVASSRVAKDVFTNNICNCTGALITTGDKALMMHLNPAIDKNHEFGNILKYIAQNIDLNNKHLQGFLIGSKPKDADSSDIFNKFLNFFRDYKIPTTVIRNGYAPINLAYRGCTDEIIVANKRMDTALDSGKKGLEALRSGFEDVNIAECDYVV